MKAFDLLIQINGSDILKGSSWLNSEYELTIFKGSLKPNKYYYYVFNKPYMEYDADVVLTLGTDEKQYLIEIDK